MLRNIGIRDYSVLEEGQRVGRIRYASRPTPGVWLWNIIVHVPDVLPIGTATGPRQAMNIRD
jgi:hypothetical protein